MELPSGIRLTGPKKASKGRAAMLQRFIMAAALCAAAVWSVSASAQNQADGFPNNTVRIVVYASPRGSPTRW